MLNWLKEFFTVFWGQVVEVITWCFETFITVISDIFFFIADGIMLAIETMITAIDFSSWFAFAGWGALPPQVLYILDVMNISACLAGLSVAYGIRLLLNLIPAAFTRV